MIRQLKAGEPMPAGEPARYLSGHGYIRLRWKVGVRSYVEVYEHRVHQGVVTDAEHVHHENHRRDDNRPENLKGLSASEHRRRHQVIDRPYAVKLYREGASTTEVARRLGTHAGNVSRILRDEGVKARRKSDYAAQVDRPRLLQAWSRASSAREVAESIGVSVPVAYRLMCAHGLPPFPPGRPRS